MESATEKDQDKQTGTSCIETTMKTFLKAYSDGLYSGPDLLS